MQLLTKNADLGPPLKTSTRRKIAIGSWAGPGDPSVYGIAELDAEPALAYIDKLKLQSGVKITFSHFVGKAVAKTLNEHPEINGVLRWGRIYPRKSIDVFFLVASDEEGADLSGLTIRNTDRKSIPEIASEMQVQIDEIRKKGDPAFKKMKKTLGGVPGFLARLVIGFSSFITGTLNLWSPLLGTPRDPFGSVWITNIGSLGMDTAFAPLIAYSRVPLLITLGAVRETPVVRDGKVVVGKTIRLCVTFDHRLIDGVHAAHMAKTVQRIFADPEHELT